MIEEQVDDDEDEKPVSDDPMRAMVENLLTADLSRIGIEDTIAFRFDWSATIPEGSSLIYRETRLESVSNIQLFDGTRLVYWGWNDYIVDINQRLYSYWTCMRGADPAFSSHQYFGIPESLWEHLSEDDRTYLAQTQQGWHSDLKMLPYRRIVVTDNIEALSKTLRDSLSHLPHGPSAFGLDIDIFEAEAEKILGLAEKFCSGEPVNPNISTQTYRLHVTAQAAGQEFDPTNLLSLLLRLEGQVRRAAVWSGLS